MSIECNRKTLVVIFSAVFLLLLQCDICSGGSGGEGDQHISWILLIMGLLGIPLGIQGRGSSRFAGVIIAFVIFIIYYLFMNAAFTLGKDGTLPPALGVWLGNIVFSVLAAYMVWEASRDRPIVFVRIFFTAGFWVQRALKRVGLLAAVQRPE